MKIKLLKSATLILLLCIIFLLIYFSVSHFVSQVSYFGSQASISLKVKNSESKLTKMAVAIKDSKSADGYSFSGVHAINYWDNCEMVDFWCSGCGLGSATSYSGFYYSPKDIPLGFQGTDMDFMESGSGWKYQEAGGDNCYYTEKITDNWYYYKMFF